MEENKMTPTPEQQTPSAQPLSEKRKQALLRYMTVLFSAAFVLVLISLILQMRTSEAKISELNAMSTSALSNAEALQEENRNLQEENLAQQQQLEALQQELSTKQAELEQVQQEQQQQQEQQKAENEMVKALRTELDRTKEAYEALLEAKSCDTREGNVTFSRAMQTLERLKDYLGAQALEEYLALGGE